MKVSIFSNDKSTAMDEIILTICVLVAIMIGVLLVVFKPSLWIISSNNSVVFGVLCIVAGVIFIPSILYRFATNSEMKKKSAEEK